MRKKEKSVLLWLIVAVFMSAGLVFPGHSGAGELEPPPGAVDENGAPQATMVTLQEIYDAVVDGCPSCDGSPVARTGQTATYATGDDGEWRSGVAWPAPRFTDNGDGTVTDNLTGLTWLKNANCFGSKGWSTALSDSNTLNSGECGLSDGSVQGDWRLPSIKEFQSLIDFGQYDPALSAGHPFSGVQSAIYWSSTTYAGHSIHAWCVDMPSGYAYDIAKAYNYYVWPVRAGN